jgi:hypothetical protein
MPGFPSRLWCCRATAPKTDFSAVDCFEDSWQIGEPNHEFCVEILQVKDKAMAVIIAHTNTPAGSKTCEHDQNIVERLNWPHVSGDCVVES